MENMQNNNMVPLNKNEEVEKCRAWLETCNLSEKDICDDGSSVTTENTNSDIQIDQHNENIFTDNCVCTDETGDVLLPAIESKDLNYDAIQIHKSKHVHIGNVTNINGPVIINQFAPTLNQQTILHTSYPEPQPFTIVPRRAWLAQPPTYASEVNLFTEPPKYIIISHSASEPSFTQTENNLNVRLIQQFHIESRKWNDIAYNFLIGAEGSVYEGRGWDTVGSHTRGYNRIGLGVCFIGCFTETPASAVAIRKAKNLIKYGVELGKISEDYKLLAHRQCSSTESPGRMLFEEIQTWENWDSSISINNPSPLIEDFL